MADKIFQLESKYINCPVHIELGTYFNGNTAVQLKAAEHTEDTFAGELILTVSVNLPDAPKLPSNQFFVKDWSENEGIGYWLMDRNIARPTNRAVELENVTVFLFEFIEEPSNATKTIH